MISQCVVPSWNLRHQRQQNSDQAELGNRSSSSHVDLDSQQQQHPHHFQQHQSFSQIVPMSSYEVTELTWENGQLAMHELGAGIFPPPTSTTSTAPKSTTWGGGGGVGRAGDTLESIVHQATTTYCNNNNNNKQSPNLMLAPHQQAVAGHHQAQNMENVGSVVASSAGMGKWAENSGPMQPTTSAAAPAPPPPASSGLVKKRTRSESDHCAIRNNNNNNQLDHESACASANAAFCRDDNNNDTTMMTWASYESPRSCTRTKTTTDEDSACHDGSENQEEERETKGETGRSYTTRKGRAAAVHNQSERRRRDRINQKMKTLQKLVPNASKTDKASMLDEVIEYLKQLQAQVQMMSNARFMPQLMMPLGMQQHLHQMSLLARMGMGMGMGAGLGMGIGMMDTTSIGHSATPPQAMPQLIHPSQVTTATSPFAPPAFVVPQMIPATQQTNPDSGAGTSATMQDPYSTLLAQSMNMDLYNRMAALQRQQQAQAQSTSNQMQLNNHVQGS